MRELHSYARSSMATYSQFEQSVGKLLTDREADDPSIKTFAQSPKRSRSNSLKCLEPKFQRIEKQIAGWTFEDWKTCLTNGTDKIRFQTLSRQKTPNPIQKVSSRSFRRNTYRSKTAEQRGDSWRDASDYIFHVGSAFTHRR